MLVFVMLLLMLSGSLYSEQIVRTDLDLQEGISLFYRVEDKSALAEIKLLCSREGEFIPSRFILDTERLLFGSFQVAGMWKYISMNSLVSSASLKDAPGLNPDRSSKNALENPAAAFLLPGRGGVMIFSGEESIQSALWAVFQPGNYTEVNTGISLVLPDPVPEDRSHEEWYGTSGTGQNSPLYHSVTEFIRERSRTSYRISAAVSAASTRVPGCSILPVFTYYGTFWDFNSRFWYNSPGWLNSKFERADSQFYWENTYTMKLNNGLQTLFKWFTAADYREDNPPVHGLQCRGEMLFSSCPLLIEYKLLPSDMSSEINHFYRIRTGWNGRVWSSRGEVSIKHDRERIQEWKASAELKRAPRSGRYSRLRCSFKAEPGVLSISPGIEESFSLGAFRFKISGGYLFELPDTAYYDPESLNLSIAVEWKKD